MENDFIDLLKYLLAGLGLIGVIIYIVSLVRIFWYESKINKAYQRKKEDFPKFIGSPLDPYYAEVKRKIENENESEIAELERKRRFILEKLPFLKR